MTRKETSPSKEARQPASADWHLPSMTPEDAAIFTSKLLETCRALIMCYFVVAEEQAVIMATWILHTYVFEAAEFTPYLHITAPEKECGKTNLMDLLAAVAAKPVTSSGTTPAALVRIVHAMKPTIFIDEMDALLKGSRESAESIRGILNAGFRRGGVFRKCNATTHELEEFNTFCPKCLTGIGELWDTVASRSIPIVMRRKRRDEVVASFRQRAVTQVAAPIRTELEAWSARGAAEILQTFEPASIANLSDRQNDIAEPLLAMAQLAGDGWLQRLTSALQTVFKGASSENSSMGATLLADVRAIFGERKIDGIPSKDLATHLREIEGRPWAEWSHGKGLTANNLARQLKTYCIYPQTIRVGSETPKGYRRGDFEDAWSRYCPLSPAPTTTTPQPASLLAESRFSNRNKQPAVAAAKSASNPHEQGVVAGVAVERQVYGQKSVCGTHFDVEL